MARRRTPTPTRLRGWAVIALVAALIATSCGDDSTDDADDSPSDADRGSTLPDDAGGDDTPPATDDEPLPPTDDEAGDGDEPPPDVPAEPIVLGVAVSDVSQFAATGPVAPRFQALADAANEAGGIAGRPVELIIEEWTLADTSGADAACIALTEDNDVFMVLGFMVPNFSDATCYTDRNEKIVLNATLVEPAEAASGRLFTSFPDGAALLLAALESLELDGAKVALYSGAGGEERIAEARAVVEELGAEVTTETVQQVTASEDLFEAESELDLHVEKWQAEGAEWLINVDGAVAGSLAALDRNGATDITVVSPTIQRPSLVALGADLAAFDTLIGTGPPSAETIATAGLHGVDDCIATVSARTGEVIEPNPPEGADNPLPTTIEVCAVWDTFVTVAEAAGPDLTTESWLQAGYELGPFPVTGSPSGRISPDSPFISQADSAVYVYDATIGEFVER